MRFSSSGKTTAGQEYSHSIQYAKGCANSIEVVVREH